MIQKGEIYEQGPSNTTICEEYVVQSAQGTRKSSTFVYLHCSTIRSSAPMRMRFGVFFTYVRHLLQQLVETGAKRTLAARILDRRGGFLRFLSPHISFFHEPSAAAYACSHAYCRRSNNNISCAYVVKLLG
jgi:hypothetical protein